MFVYYAESLKSPTVLAKYWMKKHISMFIMVMAMLGILSTSAAAFALVSGLVAFKWLPLVISIVTFLTLVYPIVKHAGLIFYKQKE